MKALIKERTGEYRERISGNEDERMEVVTHWRAVLERQGFRVRTVTLPERGVLVTYLFVRRADS
jgi:hypothetical protein